MNSSYPFHPCTHTITWQTYTQTRERDSYLKIKARNSFKSCFIILKIPKIPSDFQNLFYRDTVELTYYCKPGYCIYTSDTLQNSKLGSEGVMCSLMIWTGVVLRCGDYRQLQSVKRSIWGQLSIPPSTQYCRSRKISSCTLTQCIDPTSTQGIDKKQRAPAMQTITLNVPFFGNTLFNF